METVNFTKKRPDIENKFLGLQVTFPVIQKSIILQSTFLTSPDDISRWHLQMP